MQSKDQKEMMMKEKEKKEMQLRELARKARFENTGPGTNAADDGISSVDYERASEERLQKNKICRERRFEAKDTKMSRDRDCDISEKMALGMASTTCTSRGGEVMYDQRLFNQEKGMDSGFGCAAADAYNVYDKGLFTAQPTFSTLYRPKNDQFDSDLICMEVLMRRSSGQIALSLTRHFLEHLRRLVQVWNFTRKLIHLVWTTSVTKAMANVGSE